MMSGMAANQLRLNEFGLVFRVQKYSIHDGPALRTTVLDDLKLMDEARHRQYTGVSNGPILANLQALARAHRNIWLRVPVIPGINDREEDRQAAADSPPDCRASGK